MIQPIILFLCSVFFLISNVQGQSITNVSVIPDPRNSCDTVQVIVEGQLNNTSRFVSSSSATVGGTQVDVVVKISSSGIGNPTFVPFIDTVKVGVLSPNTYNLHVETRFQGAQQDMDNSTFKVSSCCGGLASFTLSQDTICEADTIVATATNPAISNVKWLLNGMVRDTTQSMISFGFADSGQYSISLMVDDSLCTDTFSRSLTVLPTPDSLFISMANGQLVAPNGTAYQWLRDQQPLPGETSKTITPNQEGMYQVVVYNQFGCSDTSSVFQIGCTGLANFNLSQQELCLGDSVRAEQVAPGVDSNNFQWLVNGQVRDTVSTSLSTVFSDTGEQVITSVVFGLGCADTVRDTLTVRPRPDTAIITRNGMQLSASPAAGYQWFRNNQKLQGDTSQTLSLTQSGDYHVVVMNQYGCSDTSEVFNVIIDHVNERQNMRLTVSPNPVASKLSIRLSDNVLAPSNVALHNATGQIVRQEQIDTPAQTVTIDVGNLQTGIYFLSLQTETKTLHRKVVIR